MNERGVEVDHATVQRWVAEYSPELMEQARKVMKSSADSWRMDETYSVPGVQGKHGCLNEPRVYLKYANVKAGVESFVSNARLCWRMSLSGSDLPYAGKVM
jgi:hypothetical protein